MGSICDKILDINRKDFGSIEHRKSLANFFVLDTQEVLDLPRREFKTLVIGLINGRVYGKLEASDEIKSAFFCVPIDMWNHKAIQFQQICQQAIEEMKEASNDKANEERNDDSAVETESDGEAETENSEEL